jgi:hypothetical protein
VFCLWQAIWELICQKYRALLWGAKPTLTNRIPWQNLDEILAGDQRGPIARRACPQLTDNFGFGWYKVLRGHKV